MGLKEKLVGIAVLAACATVIAPLSVAQLPQQNSGQGSKSAAGEKATVSTVSSSQFLSDPGAVARGKQIFEANCSFCHGADARGGEGGPNLVLSQLVLDDKNGEAIATVVQNGRPSKGMPKFELSGSDAIAIAAFIHSFSLKGSKQVSSKDILVGDSKAGEAFFNGPGKCVTCHSVTRDLAGIGGKYDPRTLQNRILLPGEGNGFETVGVTSPQLPPTSVVVTLPSGQTAQGKLDRIDDFSVSLTDAEGIHRTFPRNGDIPKVEINNPLKSHIDMWRVYTDEDIHNLTAYLVTLR